MSTTVELKIIVKLDPVPGWGHTPEDWLKHFQRSDIIPHHYVESVEIVAVNKRCAHCFEPEADTTCEDSILGCEYTVHTQCKPEFQREIEAATAEYTYGCS